LKPSIVGLIPCYNAAKYCENVIAEAILFCDDLILINDGSTDGSQEILRRMASRDPKKIHLIEFKSNQGKGFGLIEGFKYAAKHIHFDALVTLDADGQHFPYLIPHIAEPIIKGADLVIGGRQFSGMPIKSRFSNKIIAFLLRRFYPQAPLDTQSGMRGLSPYCIEQIVDSIHGGQYEMEFQCLLLALKKKMRIQEVVIPTIYLNKNRSSHFSPLKDSYQILKVLWDHARSTK